MRYLDKRSPHAFTLVELLVVIGIIALLIGILIPVLGAAQRAAHTLQCATNMRTIGQAMHIYANNNHGYLPYGQLFVNLPTTFNHSWDDLIDAEIGGDLTEDDMGPFYRPRAPRTLRCPDDLIVRVNDAPARSYSMISVATGGNPTFLGTATTLICYGTYTEPGYAWMVKLASIHQSADVLLLAECPSYVNLSGGQDIWSTIDMPSDQTKEIVGHVPLHNRKWNWLFVDGHVATLAPQDTLGHGPAVSISRGLSPGGAWTMRTDD